MPGQHTENTSLAINRPNRNPFRLNRDAFFFYQPRKLLGRPNIRRPPAIAPQAGQQRCASLVVANDHDDSEHNHTAITRQQCRRGPAKMLVLVRFDCDNSNPKANEDGAGEPIQCPAHAGSLKKSG
jgi:hypothetical protein